MTNSQKLPTWDEYYMGIAFAVREKANCLGNRVGAVIVKDNRVVSTGYNGVPEGMKNCLRIQQEMGAVPADVQLEGMIQQF